MAVLSAAELSSVAPLPREVPWDAWEARETMLMSISSLERPLVRDPVILMSFLWFVPKIMGSTRTWTPSSVDRGVSMAHLAGSCFVTRLEYECGAQGKWPGGKVSARDARRCVKFEGLERRGGRHLLTVVGH
jgi:hypothetical protein